MTLMQIGGLSKDQGGKERSVYDAKKHSYVQWSIIHNSQNMEKKHMLENQWMDKGTMV